MRLSKKENVTSDRVQQNREGLWDGLVIRGSVALIQQKWGSAAQFWAIVLSMELFMQTPPAYLYFQSNCVIDESQN